jgi:hypothetical protein
LESNDAVTRGRHDRETYVRTLIRLRRTQQTGVLRVNHPDGCRQLYLLDGQPLDYRSDLVEDALDEDLVEAGLLPRARIGWFRERLGQGEYLENALLDAGVITGEEMNAVRQRRLQQGVGASLEWGEGTWEFEPAEGLEAGAVEPELRPEVPFVQALWAAVCKQVDMDEVLPLVTDRAAGGFVPTAELPAAIQLLGLDPPLNALPELLGAGAAVDHLARKLPECSGDLVRLLWFLEAGGLVKRSQEIPRATNAAVESGGSPGATDSPVPASEAHSEAGPSSQQQTPAAAPPSPAITGGNPTVAQVYAARMGSDYYTFLKVPQGSDPATIKVACRQLAQQWHALAANPQLDSGDRTRVQELLRGVQQAWSTFTDAKRKAAYDDQLAAGTAPRVEGAEGSSTAAQPTRGFEMGPKGDAQ